MVQFDEFTDDLKVEYNPQRDPTEITAMAALKLLKEVAARMLEQ